MGDGATGESGTELELAVETASRAVDRCCQRQFGLTEPEARYYTAEYDRDRRRWVIKTDDFATLAGLTVETVDSQGNWSEVGQFLPTPVNAVVNSRVWTALVVNPASAVFPDGSENGIRVTAAFGWPTIPGSIKQATLLQASRLFARRHSPFGVAGNPEIGQLRLLERLDPDVAISVRPYARVWGAV
ncbi:hypothetical protein B1R94_07785 [Mycolicibacterium litorale]|nr:hypothetical protein B1R94_07785 [Mycolicibacterium litorale]